MANFVPGDKTVPKSGQDHGGVPQVLKRVDLGAIVLGSLLLWFAGVHLRLWLHDPSTPVGFGLVAVEGLQGFLFFVRRRESQSSRAPSAWLATAVGSWAFLAARPAGDGYFNAPSLFGTGPMFATHLPWLALQLVGAVMTFFSLSCLGRSFGLLAGNRGLRTAGAYRIVRHPAYASYFVTQIGYVLENLSVWNILLFSVVVIGQLWRISQEEALLSQDPHYRTYSAQVRYRLLPGVY